MTDETTAIEQYEPREESLAEFDFAATDPLAALEKAREVVTFMADKCQGSQYISNIQGRNYPKVDWWTTVGMGLALFPREVSSKRFEVDERNYGYEAVVEVCRNNIVITRASAICTTKEKSWGNRDEYAVKSMATTRATGKAYRIGLSGLAVMAGLEPTPAEEIPPQGFENGRTATKDEGHGICPEHGIAYFQSARMHSPAHKLDNGKWCNKPVVQDIPDGGFREPKSRVAEKPAESRYRKEAIDLLYDRFGGEKKPMDDYVSAVFGEPMHPDRMTDGEWMKLADNLRADARESRDATGIAAGQHTLEGQVVKPQPTEPPETVEELPWDDPVETR